MHPKIYNGFREILSEHKVKGRILEVGAIPSAQSLIAMDILQGNELVGVNMQGFDGFAGLKIIQANGNDMSMFPTGYFDCVVSNATIEHDKFFWRTCAEMRRVLRVGGLAVIGAPGYTVESGVISLDIPAPWLDDDEKSWRHCALTFVYHGAPYDYYRFSPTAFREVIFEGYRDVTISSVMVPPRLLGFGFKADVAS